jgi:hypothetical protein
LWANYLYKDVPQNNVFIRPLSQTNNILNTKRRSKQLRGVLGVFLNGSDRKSWATLHNNIDTRGLFVQEGQNLLLAQNLKKDEFNNFKSTLLLPPALLPLLQQAHLTRSFAVARRFQPSFPGSPDPNRSGSREILEHERV